MKNKVLITGASKGIGLALANVFLENGFYVIGSSRDGKIKQINHPHFEAFKLDLSSSESIERAIKNLIEHPQIDILINNAGIGLDLNKSFPEEESFKQTFDVNVTGTVFFTEAIIDIINDKGKIINISSHMGSLSDCMGSGSVAYRMSKSALNMYTKILSNRLMGSHFVASVHPGWVKTSITENNMLMARLSPEDSAKNIYRFVTSEFKSGIFWNIESQSKIEW